MKLEIFEEVDEALNGLAAFIIETAQTAIREKGKFIISLSGGSSPKKLYQLLAENPYKSQINWESVYFFFGDERYVPLDHPDSNYRMVKSVLFDPLNISQDHVFPFDTDLEPHQAAIAYFSTIQRFFQGNPIEFDLILLGLGDNSHTASLFPFTSILKETHPGVSEVYLKDEKVYRLSLNAPLINNGLELAFLVFGENKAEAVKKVLEGEKNIEEYPAQLIKPIKGRVVWFLDKAAAASLENIS